MGNSLLTMANAKTMGEHGMGLYKHNGKGDKTHTDLPVGKSMNAYSNEDLKAQGIT